jgi:hypothetical protein
MLQLKVDKGIGVGPAIEKILIAAKVNRRLAVTDFVRTTLLRDGGAPH